ncbi:DUF6541 family protein [Actinomyces urogenitalis]|uniref:DUF6541 family protein n=1 Tax=Actinomyces urogenitalis TaxID=103621 RepID=UPI00242B389F|nr:DUF6541 family protein [Actinomyces urogenitalis]MCI7456813.1 hypothetical protein [Actinomyces urogenitalis]
MTVWAQAVPTLAMLVVVTWAPGLVILLAAGARSRLARLACAPALTFAVYGVGAIVFEKLGVWWRVPTVATYVLGLAVLIAAGRRGVLAARGRRLTWRTCLAVPLDRAGYPEQGSKGGAPGEPTGSIPALAGPRWLPTLAVVVTWLVMISPILPGTGPSVPIQSADSIYHYNQAWLIEHTGNASSLNGNAGMYGLDGRYAFYPLVWHEITTLASFGWDQVVISTNTMLLLVPLVYLIGLVYLVRVILPEIRGAAWTALGASALIPIYPMRLLMDTAVWPYTLALAACPAIAARTIALWRRGLWLWRAHRRRRAVVALAAVAPAYLGLLLTHPATLIIIGWPLAAVAWTGLLLAAWRLWRHGGSQQRRFAVALLALAVLAVIALAVVVLGPGPQQAHFGRRPFRTWDYSWKKVVSALVLFYGGGGWTMKATLVAMALLCLGGVAVSMRRARHRGAVVAWLACLPLIIAAMAPVPVLSALTGVFYNNPHRIKAMTAAPALLLVTIGVSALGPWVVVRGQRLVAWGVTRVAARTGRRPDLRAWEPRTRVWTGSVRAAVTGGLVGLLVATTATWPGVRADVRGAFAPRSSNQRYVASVYEKEMMDRLADELPPDAVVIGDPVAGTAMLPFMAGVRSVWMFAGQAESDEDGLYLREHFRDIHTDAHVCEILTSHRIRYYYEDASTFFNGAWLAGLRPGLYYVDTREGFHLVDVGGAARVWEITACD